jgi:hypothetical protein
MGADPALWRASGTTRSGSPRPDGKAEEERAVELRATPGFGGAGPRSLTGNWTQVTVAGTRRR